MKDIRNIDPTMFQYLYSIKDKVFLKIVHMEPKISAYENEPFITFSVDVPGFLLENFGYAWNPYDVEPLKPSTIGTILQCHIYPEYYYQYLSWDLYGELSEKEKLEIILKTK